MRAEVVGSLLRPADLIAARTGRLDGSVGLSQFKAIEDHAIDDAIALQERLDLDVITDGELRRGIFTGPLTENIDGLEYVPGVTRTWYTADGPIEEEIPVVATGRLKLRRSAVTEEFSYARSRATKPLKVTVPSPLMMLLRWSPDHSTVAYTDAFEMAADAADIIRAEIAELAALGCTYIHVDAPEIATLVQQETRDWYEKQGISIDRILTDGLDLLNSVAAIDGVTFGLHLCRGNRNGRWMAAGGYDFVAKAMFDKCSNFDRFLLEYDDERSGSFEPLAQAPADKTLVLGLVSTKTAALESVESVLDRLKEATEFVAAEQLALSTQCGFASMVQSHPDLTDDVQIAKLNLVKTVASEFWSD